MSQMQPCNDASRESIITHVPPSTHSQAMKYQTNPQMLSKHQLSKQSFC